MTDYNQAVDGTPSTGECADSPAAAAGDRPGRIQPYRTLAVVAVGVWLAAVPVLSLLGHRRVAIIWLGVEVLALALIRLQRPNGTWIAARGRLFDVIFGVALAVGLFALSYYANLPRAQ
ncbi:hypothetical protein [Actinomyces sp. MRS3W]|uniref:hypothetical protein n=1 Tax=Actinomyces sp. MRS3W TaxID=2800796 RepID=UPI0028FD4554|nr:hypothetical protein [Actinomyces sp. MRS3W]MDU0347250.1 hypothetical protein [Actinomyces sp. MRS3W]